MKETDADKQVRRAALENSGAMLLAHVEALESLDDRAAAISDDRKARVAMAKSDGFDAKALRIVLKRRAETPEAAQGRQATDAIVDTYLAALETADET